MDATQTTYAPAADLAKYRPGAVVAIETLPAGEFRTAVEVAHAQGAATYPCGYRVHVEGDKVVGGAGSF